MSWAGSDRWELYLGVDACGLACAAYGPGPGPGPGPGNPPVWQPHTGIEQGLASSIKELRARHGRWRRRPRLRVWLSGALARPFVIEAVAGLKSSVEAHALATAMARDATGLEGECEVWLSALPRDQRALAVAMSVQLRQAIVSAARQARVTLACIRPWWARALNETLTQSPAVELFAAEDSDSVVVIGAEGQAWSAAAAYAPKPAAHQHESLIARRVLAQGIAPSAIARVRMQPAASPGLGGWPAAAALPSFEDA